VNEQYLKTTKEKLLDFRVNVPVCLMTGINVDHEHKTSIGCCKTTLQYTGDLSVCISLSFDVISCAGTVDGKRQVPFVHVVTIVATRTRQSSEGSIKRNPFAALIISNGMVTQQPSIMTYS